MSGGRKENIIFFSSGGRRETRFKTDERISSEISLVRDISSRIGGGSRKSLMCSLQPTHCRTGGQPNSADRPPHLPHAPQPAARIRIQPVRCSVVLNCCNFRTNARLQKNPDPDNNFILFGVSKTLEYSNKLNQL